MHKGNFFEHTLRWGASAKHIVGLVALIPRLDWLDSTPWLKEVNSESKAIWPVGKAADSAPLKASSSWQVIDASLDGIAWVVCNK